MCCDSVGYSERQLYTYIKVVVIWKKQAVCGSLGSTSNEQMSKSRLTVERQHIHRPCWRLSDNITMMSGMLGSENKCIGPKHFELAGTRIIAETGQAVGCAFLPKENIKVDLNKLQVFPPFKVCYLAPVSDRIHGTNKDRTCGGKGVRPQVDRLHWSMRAPHHTPFDMPPATNRVVRSDIQETS